MPEVKPGTRLKSVVCSGEAMVVKGTDIILTCGGVPMIGPDEAAPESKNAPDLIGRGHSALTGARDQIRTGIPFAPALRAGAHTRCSSIARSSPSRWQRG